MEVCRPCEGSLIKLLLELLQKHISCPNASIFLIRIRLLFYGQFIQIPSRNKLKRIYQYYCLSKSEIKKKKCPFGQEICFCHYLELIMDRKLK